jgi:hypothetical protein
MYRINRKTVGTSTNRMLATKPSLLTSINACLYSQPRDIEMLDGIITNAFRISSFVDNSDWLGARANPEPGTAQVILPSGLVSD